EAGPSLLLLQGEVAVPELVQILADDAPQDLVGFLVPVRVDFQLAFLDRLPQTPLREADLFRGRGDGQQDGARGEADPRRLRPPRLPDLFQLGPVVSDPDLAPPALVGALLRSQAPLLNEPVDR